ncbi:unnamed protein product, partial [Sphacelaria rigidula]
DDSKCHSKKKKLVSVEPERCQEIRVDESSVNDRGRHRTSSLISEVLVGQASHDGREDGETRSAGKGTNPADDVQPEVSRRQEGVVRDMACGGGGILEMERMRALRVIRSLAPRTIIPLLTLAEQWLGGENAIYSDAAVDIGLKKGPYSVGPCCCMSNYRASTAGDGGYAESLVGEHNRDLRDKNDWLGDGLVRRCEIGTGTGGVGGGDPRDQMPLSVIAIRDLKDMLVSAVDTGRRLEDLHAERTRVQERDGLLPDKDDGAAGANDTNIRGEICGETTPMDAGSIAADKLAPLSSQTSDLRRDAGALIDHACWHVAGTVPTILEN